MASTLLIRPSFHFKRRLNQIVTSSLDPDGRQFLSHRFFAQLKNVDGTLLRCQYSARSASILEKRLSRPIPTLFDVSTTRYTQVATFSSSSCPVAETTFDEVDTDSPPIHAPSSSSHGEIQSTHLIESSQITHNQTTEVDDGNQSDGTDNQSLHKQSIRATRVLYQMIAPHVEYRTLHQLTKQLSKAISRDSKSKTSVIGDKYKTLKRRLEILFEPDGKQDSSYSWSIKGHPWIEPIIHSYLMGEFLDENTLGSFKNDASYPPIRNRENYEGNVAILLRARETCIDLPMFSSEKIMRDQGYSFTLKNRQHDINRDFYRNKLLGVHSMKSNRQLKLEAEAVMDILSDSLPPPHFKKLMGLLDGFSKLDIPEEDDRGKKTKKSAGKGKKSGSKAATSSEKKNTRKSVNYDDSWCIDDDEYNTNSYEPYSGTPQTARTDWKRYRIPILGKFLDTVSNSHGHLVAGALASYFYIDIPKEAFTVPTGGSRRKNTGEDAKANEATFTISKTAVRKHHKLHSAELRFFKTRDKFVDKLMKMQHDFVDSEECEDMLDENLKALSEERNADNTVEEVVDSILDSTKVDLGDDIGVAEKNNRGRPKKGVHLHFTAVSTNENHVPSLTEAQNFEERIVFINNLPIDSSEEEIDAVYSRCGPLDSIQLFNLRPDLDPGPLSKKQLEERRRKSRLSNISTNVSSDRMYAKYQQPRPRTPVYGMLTFKTAEGYKTATCPELSIFGCVIRRHPVLSIPPQDVTTLYLEQIPSNVFSMDVEFKLGRLLHSHGLSVTLDGMGGVGRRSNHFENTSVGDDSNYQEYSEPSSCEIKFEDFQSAYAAYHLMREEGAVEEEISNKGKSVVKFLGGEDCQVHWFRTPRDRMKYWTRELIF